MSETFTVRLYAGDGEAVVEVLNNKYKITIADLEAGKIIEGDTATEDDIEFLTAADEKLRCIKKAFNYLSYKAYSKRSLALKLKRAAFSDRAVEKVIGLLETKGYLNDAALCKEYAENLQKYKGYGALRIKKELYAKGFDRDCIDETVEALPKCAEALITEQLRKKFPHLNSSDRQARAKAVAYLSSRGYEYDEISNAISMLENCE